MLNSPPLGLRNLEAEYCIGEHETAHPKILGEIHIHVNNRLLKRKSIVLLPKGSLEVPKKKKKGFTFLHHLCHHSEAQK